MKLLMEWIIGTEIILLIIILLAIPGCADKLAEVNYKINKNPYIIGKYDCKNYVDDKYKELIKIGYKEEDIKFVITKYEEKPHVVINVDNWILDNNFEYPYPATKRMQVGLNYHYWSSYRNM